MDRTVMRVRSRSGPSYSFLSTPLTSTARVSWRSRAWTVAANMATCTKSARSAAFPS